jgi:uroporphyrinogen-III synthase
MVAGERARNLRLVTGNDSLSGYAIAVTGEQSRLALRRLLESRGAKVVPVPAGQSDRLLETIVQRRIDAVAVTTDTAAAALVRAATLTGRLDELGAALSGDVLVLCLTEAAAEPLRAAGADARRPAQPLATALVEEAEEALAGRTVRVHAAGRDLEVRGRAVMVDGRPIRIAPAPIAVLRRLAESPGELLSGTELGSALPSPQQGDHAVEMAVCRLRRALDGIPLVETVMKRGYRIAV